MDEQTLRKLLKEELQGFAKKDDLKGVATKSDLEGFATKDDLKALATKDDLEKSETKVIEEISHVIHQFADRLNEKKAEQTQVNALEMRVNDLEKKVYHN